MIYTGENFDSKYTYNENIVSTEFDEDQAGMLETYGADFEQVLKIREEQPKTLWTVVDGDNGELLILAGFHIVNRVYFVITNEEWTDETEEYVLFESESD